MTTLRSSIVVDIDVGELQHRRPQLTLRLTDGRAMEFSLTNDEGGSLHRGLFRPDQPFDGGRDVRRTRRRASDRFRVRLRRRPL